MKSNNQGLGSVDAFGFNEFGQAAGLNPMWGAVVGTGLGTVGAIATRQFSPKMAKHSELVGLGLSALASGGMIFFEGTRAAGWTGLASAFLNNGLRQMEQMFFRPKLPEVAATAAEMGAVVIDPTQSLGLVEIENTQALAGSDMPTLVGANLAAANEHVQLVGGPQLAQHAGHWGSTVIGAGQ
jgi:hypothetical protein